MSPQLPNMAAPEWQAVREALERARQWDTATGMRIATRPDPMREIRLLVDASRRSARHPEDESLTGDRALLTPPLCPVCHQRWDAAVDCDMVGHTTPLCRCGHPRTRHASRWCYDCPDDDYETSKHAFTTEGSPIV